MKKKLLCLLLSTLLVFTLTGCGANETNKKYKNYVKCLIGINYLGATDDYIESAGVNKSDAESLYAANIDVLTDNILNYYSISLPKDSAAYEKYRILATNIYSKVNYSVSDPYEQDGKTLIDVTIYPINIFAQTKEDVMLYIDSFNQRVARGEFNDYTIDEYNEEFSLGLSDILSEACNVIEYADPIIVTVTIIDDGNNFYISNEDFLAIDAVMIKTD